MPALTLLRPLKHQVPQSRRDCQEGLKLSVHKTGTASDVATIS